MRAVPGFVEHLDLAGMDVDYFYPGSIEGTPGCIGSYVVYDPLAAGRPHTRIAKDVSISTMGYFFFYAAAHSFARGGTLRFGRLATIRHTCRKHEHSYPPSAAEWTRTPTGAKPT